MAEMGAIRSFFRTHPWYRRLFTLSLTVVAALALGLVTYPYVSEWRALRDLSSTDAETRRVAVYRAIRIAGSSERFVRRLNQALEKAGNDEFLAIAEVLDTIGKFHTPQRRPVDVDRLRAYEMLAALNDPDVTLGALRREEIVSEAVLNRRDNAHVRRILASAAGDERQRLRRMAAVLAAVLGDDATLGKLLSDQDGQVASDAALSAAMAGRGGLYGQIFKLIEGGDVEKVSSAAYAAAALRPKESSQRICDLLAKTGNAALRDRLLHVAALLGDSRSRQVVLDMLASCRKEDKFPPAMALVAAVRAKLTPAESEQLIQDVRDVIKGARKGNWRADTVAAAVGVADRLGADVLEELVELWGRAERPHRLELVWVPVARLMGSLAAKRGQDDPQRKSAERVLKSLADYYDQAVTIPPKYFTMPVASAAAAAALWKLPADGAEAAVRKVAASGGQPAVDCLVWGIGRRGGPLAGELALKMLSQRAERAAGAVLAALSAETDQQRQAAAKRVTELLTAGLAGGETDADVIDTYRCALLVLGQENMLPEVRQMFTRLPRRPALTALLAAGDLWVLDRLLWGWQRDADVDYLLVDEGAADVLAETAPALPLIDAAGEPELRLWQARIMRHYYVINRPSIRVGLKR